MLEVDFFQVFLLIHVLVNKGNAVDAHLTFVDGSDGMFVLQAHLLQLQQTGNHLQVVFHAVMNFFEQDIFVVECIIERGCSFLDNVFELCFIAHEFPGAQTHEGEKENRQCKNYNRVKPYASV